MSFDEKLVKRLAKDVEQIWKSNPSAHPTDIMAALKEGKDFEISTQDFEALVQRAGLKAKGRGANVTLVRAENRRGRPRSFSKTSPASAPPKHQPDIPLTNILAELGEGWVALPVVNGDKVEFRVTSTVKGEEDLNFTGHGQAVLLFVKRVPRNS